MKKIGLAPFLAGLLILLLFAGRLAAHPSSLPPAVAFQPSVLSPQPAVSALPFTWITQRLTTPARFELFGMSNNNLALDAAGNPHIVYGANGLYYSWYDGTTWHRELVDGRFAETGLYASIALDAAGNPHIAYVHFLPYEPEDTDQRELWYAHRAGNHWQYVELDQGRLLSGTAIAIDSQGYPHIAYDAGSSRGVFYVHQNSNGWFYYPVSGFGFKKAISLALDAADHAHISYITEDNYLDNSIWYARWTGSEWQNQTVETVEAPYNVFLLSSSIALDSHGRPLIAYHIGSGLRLASYTDNGWSLTSFNNDVYGKWVSLAIDNNDVLHLAYYDSSTDGQMYATRPAGTWLITQVDTALESGNHTSLKLDAQGRPCISYGRYPEYYGDIAYAQLDGEQWSVETVDSLGYDSVPTLVVDNTDKLHALFLSRFGTQSYYTYMYQTEAGWVTEPTNPVSYSSAVSFVLDANNNPHFAYFDANDDLYYVHRLNGQWVSELIADDAAYNSGALVSLALDQKQNPHLAFYHVTAGQLHYAHLEGNTWLTEIVPDGGADLLSMQLDQLGQPHLAYRNVVTGYLDYGYLSADQWITSSVAANVSSATLELDSQDRPHIAYWVDLFYTDAIAYVFWNGSGWTGGPVYSSEIPPNPPWDYLALDSHDRPHIVYQHHMNQPRLKYIYYNEDGIWPVHEMGEGSQNGGLSIVLNSADHPYVLHMEGFTGRLLLSTPAASITYAPLITKP
jgi:hypothetical protein